MGLHFEIMDVLAKGSVRKSLAILVVLSLLPAFAILFYSGLKTRQQTIESATQKVGLIVKGMAAQQREVVRSTRHLLTTLATLPDVRQLKIDEIARILGGVVAQNPNYKNLALVALDGTVLASGTGHTDANLADRKHFQEALSGRRFAVGELIISRVGTQEPVFPSAAPILDDEGNPVAVLTLVLKLGGFSGYIDTDEVPVGSFVAATDHKGLRIYYYPEQRDTNPIGRPIKSDVWELALNVTGPGIFTRTTSDGKEKIIAFESVSLDPGDPPYIYFWSGIPERLILSPANDAFLKSLLFLSLALIMTILVARHIGRKLIIDPLLGLVRMVDQLAKGDLKVRSDASSMISEFDVLADAFDQMAESLQENNEKLSRLSMIDGVTNIANRRGFDKKLDEEWRRHIRTRRPLSLLMIDIDYFKKFNDAYGHLAGDDCLRNVGLILQSVANRASDFPARYGGEEFAVILPETDRQGAIAIAESIHDQVAQRAIPHEASDISRYLTVSIGLAAIDEAKELQSPLDLIKMADEYLYKAKHDGRNRTAV